VSCWPTPSADARRCTTRRGNAHGTDEREVHYAFHPWTGCIVHIHEVIKKPSGDVARCSRDGDATGRWLELPTWMLDRAACAAIRVEKGPCVHMAALSALMAVIRRASSDGDGTHLVTSTAPIPGVTRISHGSNRRVSHATPQSSSGCSKHRETVRPVRPSERSRHRRGAARLADTARSDAPNADRPFHSPNPRPRTR
jgi:hypothetical protein